jgi:hypothetical protein
MATYPFPLVIPDTSQVHVSSSQLQAFRGGIPMYEVTTESGESAESVNWTS